MNDTDETLIAENAEQVDGRVDDSERAFI